MRKAFRIMLRVFAAFAVVFVVAAAVFFWRVSQGPIEVSFLTPYLQRALNSGDQNFRVETKRTVIAWAGWGRGIQLQARDLSISRANGEPLAEVPVLGVRLSLRALVGGEFAPIEVTVQRPQLYLERAADGRISLGLKSKRRQNSQFVPGLLRALVRDRRDEGPLRLLTTVRIEAAELNIDDRYLGRVWRSRNLTVAVTRKGGTVLSTMSFDLAVGTDSVRFDAYGSYDIKTEVIGLDLVFKRLDPAMFASARGGLQALGWFKTPIGGTFRLKIADGAVSEASFDLSGRDGAIAIPGYYDQPLDLTRFKTKGRVVDNGRRLRVETFEADFHGTKITISGVFSGLEGALGFGGSVAIVDLPVNDLPKFWPRELKANARNWVAENIDGGLVRTLNMRVELNRGGPGGALAVGKLHGTFRYSGMSVRFQRNLPQIKEVGGFATFSERDLRFTLEGGDLEGVSVVRGRVDILEFDKPLQRIDIEVQVSGKLADILTVIDRKPLRFARRLGVNPLAVGGTAEATIRSAFVLYNNVGVDDINITASAKIRDMNWRKGMFGQDLEKGTFTLDVSKLGFVLDGRTLLGGTETKLRWEESFGKKVKVRRRYDVDTVFTVDDLKTMGIDVTHIFHGRIGAKLDVAGYDGGRDVIRGEFDLREASMTLPLFGARKPPGMAASARASFIVNGGRVRAIEGLEVKSAAIDVKGNVFFHTDGATLKELKIERLRTGRQLLSAHITGTAKGAKTGTVTGQSLDMEAILKNRDKGGKGVVSAINLTGEIARVYFGKNRYVTNFRGAVVYDGERVDRLTMTAGVPGGSPLSIRLSRAGPVRRLSIETANAGAAFRALDVVDTLKGGRLTVSAVARTPKAPLAGRATLSEFRVAQAPVFARILALASLKGIANLTASDEGVAFSQAEIPFYMQDGLLTVVNARAVGSQIGITMSGDVSLKKDHIALKGTVVPAYTLNSLLGKLPLIGRVLVGEKGSGIFAASYSVRGALANPAMNVNALSVLTPGFLRNIFSGGSADVPTSNSTPNPPGGPVFEHDKVGR